MWRILGGYPAAAFAAGSVLNAASVHQSYYLFEHSAGLACNVVEQMDGENLDVRNVIEWEQNLAGFEVVTNTRVLTSLETSALWTAAGSLLILLNSLLRVVEK